MTQELIAILAYTSLFYSVFSFLKTQKQLAIFSSAPQRLYAMIVLFYATLPTSLAFTLIFQQGPEISPLQLQLLFANIGFYVFGTIEEFRAKARPDKAIIIHHLAFGSVMFCFACFADFNANWLWLLTMQVTGVFVYSKKVLFGTPFYYTYKSILNQLDFIAFTAVRIVGQSVFMFYIVFQEIFIQQTPHSLFFPLLLPAFILSTILNLNWFQNMLQKRVFKTRRTLLQSSRS